MDIDGVIALMIPLSAIVLGCGLGFFSKWSKHQQEMARIQATKSVGVDNAGLESLRREVMSLRDTTTQYDMSVERTLTEIKSRLAQVEKQNGLSPNTQPNAGESRLNPPQAPTVSQFAGDQDERKVILGGQS